MKRKVDSITFTETVMPSLRAKFKDNDGLQKHIDDNYEVADDAGNPVQIKVAAETAKPEAKGLDESAVRKVADEVASQHVAKLKGEIGTITHRWLPEGLKTYRPVKSFNTGNRETDRELAFKWGAFMLAAMGNQKYLDYCKQLGVPIVKGQSENVNTAGGFLVPEELTSSIIDLREQYGVFRREARVVPMASDTLKIPRRTGGLTVYWPGEGGTITDSSKTWDQVTMVAKKMATLTLYTSEVAADAIINVGDDLANEIAYAFAYNEDLCGFIGDGTSTYGGITGVTKALQAKWPATTSDTAGVIVATGNLMSEAVIGDINDVVAALPQYAAPNAKWYVSRFAAAKLFNRLSTAVAAGMAQNVATLALPIPQTFLGYPVVITQAMLASIIMAVFGDLKQACTLGDRGQMQIAVSSDAYFTSDQFAIRGTQRIDIKAHDVGDGTTAGPVIGLQGLNS